MWLGLDSTGLDGSPHPEFWWEPGEVHEESAATHGLYGKRTLHAFRTVILDTANGARRSFFTKLRIMGIHTIVHWSKHYASPRNRLNSDSQSVWAKPDFSTCRTANSTDPDFIKAALFRCPSCMEARSVFLILRDNEPASQWCCKASFSHRGWKTAYSSDKVMSCFICNDVAGNNADLWSWIGVDLCTWRKVAIPSQIIKWIWHERVLGGIEIVTLCCGGRLL